MAEYKIKLKDKKEIAEGTMAFYFEKPKGFEFKAGQFNDWTITNPVENDNEGNTRAFSIASAPSENYLMFASRMRKTAFKNNLKNMTIETEIKIEGPFGDFTLHNDVSRPAVLLAGGIGITPFRSIILQTTAEKTPHKIFLFYSNRRPQDAAFLEELENTDKESLNFKMVATMTNTAGTMIKWGGETGYINQEILSRYLDNLSKPIHYIAGPPTMVLAMKTMLNQSGINDDDIHIEEFAGY